MLAFVMAAVSALMGSSILNFRKSKANIAVQNTAQTTYDQISDSMMQAERIVICGYEASADVDFKEYGLNDTVPGSFTEAYYVANDEIKAEYVAAGHANVKLFSEITPNTKIFVKKLIIDVSVPFEPDDLDTGDLLIKRNWLTGKDVTIKNYTEYDKETVDASGNKITSTVREYYTDASGNKVYDTNDTLRYTYTFSGSDLYCEKEYAFSTGKNYTINWSIADSKRYGLYCDSVKCLKSSIGQEIEGCIVTVDVKNGAIGLEFHFNDKDFTYDTDGLVKIRNSNVLENK